MLCFAAVEDFQASHQVASAPGGPECLAQGRCAAEVAHGAVFAEAGRAQLSGAEPAGLAVAAGAEIGFSPWPGWSFLGGCGCCGLLLGRRCARLLWPIILAQPRSRFCTCEGSFLSNTHQNPGRERHLFPASPGSLFATKARQSGAREPGAIRRTSGGCCQPRILFGKHLLQHRCVYHGALWVGPSTYGVCIVRFPCLRMCITDVVVCGCDLRLSSVFDIKLSLQV